MNKMPEDLRWLAENVSEWTAPKHARIAKQGDEAWFLRKPTNCGQSFTFDQWQTARQQLEDERMDREEGNPSWSAWIAWAGGKCPLPSGAMHEVQFRSGERAKDDSPETSYWEHDQSSCDIVAYRYLIGRAEADPDERINNIARNGGDGLHYDVIMTEEEEAMGVDERVEWDGEGPPPVGCECELLRGKKWVPVEITGKGKLVTVFRRLCNSGFEEITEADASEFRPIRTKAERDREELESTLLRWKDSTVEVIAGILIDNGWKKDDRND